jgi:hypothetical protein
MCCVTPIKIKNHALILQQQFWSPFQRTAPFHSEDSLDFIQQITYKSQHSALLCQRTSQKYFTPQYSNSASAKPFWNLSWFKTLDFIKRIVNTMAIIMHSKPRIPAQSVPGK